MLAAVRYGIPAVLIVVGQVVLVVGGEGAKLEGWALFTGAGLAVLLLNVLHRTGVEGDHERTREQDARGYFDRHGRWPDEGGVEERQRLEQPARERPDSPRYGPPPIETPPPRLRRPPRRRGD